jgi:hypothetical protein
VKKVLVGALAAAVVGAGAGSTLALGSARPDTQRMVLRQSDLPAGFVQREAKYVSNAQQTAASNGDRDYDKLGRVTGYSASFDRTAAKGMLQVGSEANLYRTAALAHASFTSGLELVSKQKEIPIARLPLRGFPAADAALYRATATGTPRVDVFVVVWRTGTVISTVSGGGLAGTVDRSAVIALARKQQQRVAAAAR